MTIGFLREDWRKGDYLGVNGEDFNRVGSVGLKRSGVNEIFKREKLVRVGDY